MLVQSSRIKEDDSQQIRSGNGEFTNPLLECDVAQGTINSTKLAFDKKLESLVSEMISSNLDNKLNISVYFRDLNNGPVVGINENINFMPASLLKVPVMMSFLKHSERDPSILSKKILYEGKKYNTISQTIIPKEKLVAGKEYTVEELIERMIKYSDNEALALLWPNISSEEYVELYKLFGVNPNSILDPNYGITVKEYSRFFRILFNSSFLSQANSEGALKLLSESEFKDGIRKNIPKDIKVASKFGERGLENGTIQIHECGIIYYPKHPYLLCVMTRGEEGVRLIEHITEISDFVFTQIKEQYSL